MTTTSNIKLFNGGNFYYYEQNNYKISKNNTTNTAWAALSKFDDNNDGKLDSGEFENFKKFVEEAANSDGNPALSKKELAKLASMCGVDSNSLLKSINYVSGVSIAREINKSFHPTIFGLFSKKSNDELKEIIGMIDESNLDSVMNEYHRIMNLDYRKSGKSIPFDILNEYSLSEANELLQPILGMIQSRAAKSGKNVTSIIKEYNMAVKNNNTSNARKSIKNLMNVVYSQTF